MLPGRLGSLRLARQRRAAGLRASAPPTDRAPRGYRRDNRDSCPLAETAGLGGVPEAVEPRSTDRAQRGMLAGSTGLEPAASGVTGRRSNQLNYDPNSPNCGLRIADG